MEFGVILGSLFRTGIATAGGSLVSSGIISANDLQSLSGAGMVLGVLIWSLAQKHFSKKK